MNPPLIELRNVGKSFTEGGRTRIILQDVNLRIERGELIVLLGRSGSGKSTVLNLISGIETPSHGEILLSGVPLHSLTERDRTLLRRREIGFVFQAYNLIPTLTVFENVCLPLELNKRPDAQAATRLLAKLELQQRVDSYPDRLSGGEQQRVAIARALVHDPAFILADEPTGNLDIETGRIVLQLLDTMTRASGKTLIMATHSREVIGMADRILTVTDGRVVPLDQTMD